MPTNVYLNSGAQDLSLAASYTPAAVPVAGDSLFIQAGSQAVNTNPAALTAINLARVFVSSGFKGSLGSAGAPVEFGNVTSLELDGGGGQHYLKTGTTTACRVVGSAGGKIWLSGGTYTTLSAFGGDVEASGAATITNLKQLGGSVTARKLTTGAAFTSIVVKGGVLLTERSFATLELVRAAGQVTAKESAAATTKLRIMDGRYNHLSDGAITYLEGIGGTLSTKGAEKIFAVTNAELWDGFSIDDASQLTYISYTNQPTLYGFRGGNALR